MIAINQSIIEKLLRDNRAEIDLLIYDSNQRVLAFENTSDRSGGRRQPRIPITLSQSEQDYLELLLANYEYIVKAKQHEIDYWKVRFDQIISGVAMSKNHKEFKNELLNRIGYVKLRSDFYPKYFDRTGIKACVYCNAQLALTVVTEKKKRSAKFQVDHFLPKSEYPCFSISFYNLVPSCAPCNGKKSAKAITGFNYYSDKPSDLQRSPFKFELDMRSVIKYRVNGDANRLEILFKDAKNIGFDSNFDIKGIYNKQKDLAEELVLKSIIYNQAYLTTLRNSFKKLYPNKAPMVERLVVGNYTRPKDIHKRPMAKFMMDIAKQLGLI